MVEVIILIASAVLLMWAGALIYRMGLMDGLVTRENGKREALKSRKTDFEEQLDREFEALIKYNETVRDEE